MQRKYKLVMIVIISLFLIGGASMAIIKGVDLSLIHISEPTRRP